MGQYHKLVNLDRREYIDPHKLGSGLKQVEQLGTHPSTGAALLVLLASHSTGDGGGDFDLLQHTNIVGQWRGDRIAMVGDYDDDVTYTTGPLQKDEMTGNAIYCACAPKADDNPEPWLDVSDLVAAVIEQELGGKFQGWQFVYADGETGKRLLAPDMILTSR